MDKTTPCGCLDSAPLVFAENGQTCSIPTQTTARTQGPGMGPQAHWISDGPII